MLEAEWEKPKKAGIGLPAAPQGNQASKIPASLSDSWSKKKKENDSISIKFIAKPDSIAENDICLLKHLSILNISMDREGSLIPVPGGRRRTFDLKTARHGSFGQLKGHCFDLGSSWRNLNRDLSPLFLRKQLFSSDCACITEGAKTSNPRSSLLFLQLVSFLVHNVSILPPSVRINPLPLFFPVLLKDCLLMVPLQRYIQILLRPSLDCRFPIAASSRKMLAVIDQSCNFAARRTLSILDRNISFSAAGHPLRVGFGLSLFLES
jgi:hypothetical protein